ncbi:peptidase C14 caspase catalytic subunit p20 [Streptomyces sp. NPDC059247]|uniref:peptidase C14 caspase catalytic subunit p20 n=1 Tax=Streptomyces sp. NPDC059247 TaxID=3346790 RepID=UPI003676C172
MVEHLTMIRSERRASALVGTVAVSRYAHPVGARRVLPDLRNVSEVRDRFTGIARDRLGFGDSVAVDAEGATRARLWAGIEDFLAHGAERKILYWTGHGYDLGPLGYFLACEDSCTDGRFDPGRAIALTDLVDRLLSPGSAADTLLVVDACFSHGHLPAALDRALSVERDSVGHARRHRKAGFVVVATSGTDSSVPEGRWVDWLEEVLRTPEFIAADHARPFDPAALHLPVPYLLEAVDGAAAASGIDEPAQRPGYTEVRALPNSFLDNPYFVEPRRKVHTTAVLRDRTPWFGAEQFGLEDDGHLRRHFAGRHGALSRVVRWMDTHPRGLLAVTGPAGSGKTALLGRLALTSLPSWRDGLGPDLPPATLPRTGTVHAALSCRGRSLHSLTGALWQVLAGLDGMPPPPEGPVTPERCRRAVDELVAASGSLNLLFDALDEALPEQAHEIARHLLNPLAALWGVRVVVATRPQPRRRTTAREAEETLTDTLDQSVAPLVLGDDEEAGESIAGMVASVLAEAPPYPHAEDREWIARTVAARSRGSFLVARLTARYLARRPWAVTEAELTRWMDEGRMDLGERFAEEIGHLAAQEGAERAEEVLRPLAVVQEPGLARRGPWLVLANALRDEGSSELTAGDLHRVGLGAAGGIVVRQLVPDSRDSSFHLAHPSYGPQLLRRAGLDTAEAHLRAVTALRGRASADWRGADAYTLGHLGAHAAEAGPGHLRALFEDLEFLVRTDPAVMLPLASALARDCDGAALYGRVGDAFRDLDVPERRALLRATAFVSHRETAYALLERSEGFLPWQEYWTDQPPDPLEWRLPAPLGGARTLSWTAGTGATERRAGDTLAAGGRGEVLVLDAESGLRLLTRRTHGAERARGEALAEVREVGTGPHRTTVARDDRAVYFWRSGARRPDYAYRWGGAVRTLAAVERGAETIVWAADGRHLWMWRWQRGALHQRDESLVDIRTADTERLAALVLGRRVFLLAAGRRAVLHEVDLGVRGGRGLLGAGLDLGALGYPAVAAAALDVPSPDGRPQGWLAAADGGRVSVWLCETDDRAGGPVEASPVHSFASPARGLAFGRCGEVTLLAVQEGLTVRVLDPADPGREARFALTAPGVGALAFEPNGRGVLAVADGSHIRVLEVASALGTGRGLPRRSHDQRPLVALAEAGGEAPLLCRVRGDRVLVSRPGRGAPASDPVVVLGHVDQVTAVRAERCAGSWVVVAAARRTVRLWLLSEELSVRAEHDLELGGDAGNRVPALGLLVDEAAGVVRLYAPDRQRVECAELSLGGARGWRRGESVPAGVRACGVDARAMTDGTSWLAADLGDALLLWEHREGGLARAERIALPGRGDSGPQVGRIALGEWHDAEEGESVPLLAWVDAGTVRVAECAPGSGKRRTLPGDGLAVTSLVFAGAPERPLLLVCDERRAPAVWDVRAGTWLGGAGVPRRGYPPRASAAARDRGGLVVALQGDHRCDLIRLPASFLAPPGPGVPVPGGP